MTIDIGPCKEDITELMELLISFRKLDQMESYREAVDSIRIHVDLIVSSVKNPELINHKDYFDNLRQFIESEIKDVQKSTKIELKTKNMKGYQNKLRLIKCLMGVKSSLPLCMKIDVIQSLSGSMSEETKKEMNKIANKISNGTLSI